jgi:PPOX class probable F420-dependent enzyme
MVIDDAIRAFLQKPLIARLSTIGADGYPHTVPIWFAPDGDSIVFISDRDNRKVRNALANPKGAVTIGGDRGDGAGYLFRGTLTVEDDHDHAVMHQMVDRYERPEAAAALKDAWKEDDVVVIRLTPHSVVRVY